MNRLIFFVCILGLNIQGNAQSPTQIRVQGTITSNSGEALAYANVILYRVTDSLFLKGDISNEDGFFDIEISMTDGENTIFKIVSSMIGFETAESAPFDYPTNKPLHDIGIIKLIPSSASLEEVTVVARKPFIERKADRLIVNVDQSIISAGSSALEVLERSPGVFVNTNDNISLRGKAGVILMVDGKITPLSSQELANMLRGMPASNIDRVEIITNPSSKYDAAGNAGIIDIRLKKDQRLGTNGTLTANYGQGVYPKTGGGINLNYRNRKINAFGSYNYSYRMGFNKLDLLREFYTSGQSTGAYDQRNYLVFPFKYYTGRAGIDYNMGKKTILGLVYTNSQNNFDPYGENNSNVLDGEGNKIAAFRTGNESHDRWPSFTINANVKHSIGEKGKEITADVDYMRFRNTTDQLFTTDYFGINGEPNLPTYLLAGDLKGDLQIRSLKADYVHPLSGNAKWEAGIKTSLVTADNNALFLDVSIPDLPLFDSTKSNHFEYLENLNAAYINYSKDWDKFNFQIGVRAEQTRVEGKQFVTGETFDTTYTNLFPSAFLNYKFTPNYEMGMNLSRRLDRPSYQQLNPFKFFLDPSTYREGNIYLRPQYTWAAEWSHTLFQKYTATFGMSRTTNNITQVIAPVEGQDRITVQTDKNLAQFDYIGLNLSAPFELTKWWSSVNSVQLYRGHYSGNLANTNLANGNVVAFMNTNNSFRFSNDWSVELGCWYQSRLIYGFMDLEPQWALSAGIQKSFFNRQATVRLNVSDVFWTSPPSAVITFRDYVEAFDVKRETRVANISCTWRFGNNQVTPSRRRTGGAEDERRRASQGQG